MFNWSTFLVLAEELAQRDDPQSKRSAISRAYYYAFHLVKDFVTARGVYVPPDGNAHDIVWEAVVHDCKLPINVKRVGIHLKSLRRRADYTRDFPLLRTDTRDAISAAKFVESSLKRAGKPRGKQRG